MVVPVRMAEVMIVAPSKMSSSKVHKLYPYLEVVGIVFLLTATFDASPSSCQGHGSRSIRYSTSVTVRTTYPKVPLRVRILPLSSRVCKQQRACQGLCFFQ